ncbi:unnamed protein product [Leptidea sinapis]|uniref:Lethal giant larvae homologue 2 domain-containing protein n=1 Tax=Leptidea sinapis TaxID=189913 RepID=A0A5E4R1C8_9NEOP|nr:unnamed protein product [Leptidea sinapis]
MQNCPEDFKVNPGAVESICEHPKSPSKVLIGYNRGLVVLWDRESATPTHTFVSNQQLESLCWNDEGDHFTSSHNDGSYVTWEVAGAASDRPLKEPITPYGPYPCKAITKILNRTSLDGDEVVIYAGGMPRASYSDKYTVTVQQGEKHVAFDFTSRVIDFFTTTQVPPDGAPLQEDRPATPAQLQMQTVNQVAAALVVLAEEELVVIDLCDPKWRPLRLPYLVSIHASAVTTMYLVDNIADTVYDNIVAAGEKQVEDVYSSSAWPISGGIVESEEPTERQVLLTGHEDGSVSGEEIGENNDSQNEEEEWPPFRRVGTFDPYSDDPRLAVKRTAPATAEVKSIAVNIVSDRDGFVAVAQLSPPAAVTSLAAQWEWGVVCAGTAHGLALLDAFRAAPLTHKCTLNPHDHSGAGDTPISRRKSFKKSLRESFRRLRKGRSQRRQTTTASSQTTPTQPSKKPVEKIAENEAEVVKPVERAVEARSNDDAFGSMVRCLYFARTFLINIPTLWAGTNNGTVFAFTINVPSTNKRKDEPSTSERDSAEASSSGDQHHKRHAASGDRVGGAVQGLHAAIPQAAQQVQADGARGGQVRERRRATPRVVSALSNKPRRLSAASHRPSGITSLCFSKRGEALYLHSSSELQRITLSATKQEESVEANHDVTAASADITVDSVRDHTQQQNSEQPELNINLQNSQVNTSSMVVKTTTRTTMNENGEGVTTTTTTNSISENILEHSREEGVITRIESPPDTRGRPAPTRRA